MSVIITAFALWHAYLAHKKSQEIIDTFLRQVTNFDDFAKYVTSEFLADAANSKIKISLISPAFAALSEDESLFRSFLTNIKQLHPDVKGNIVQILFVDKERLVNWYTGLIDSMNKKSPQKIVIIKRCIKTLNDIKEAFCTLNQDRNIMFKTRKITFQIFIREDKKARKAMYGNLYSDFHEKVPYMLGKEKAEYDEIVQLSKGFYSQAKIFFEDQEEVFDRCWKAEEVAGGDANLSNAQIHEYFTFIINGLRSYQDSLSQRKQNEGQHKQ